MAIRQPSAPRAKPPTRPRWQSKYHGVRMTPEEYLALPEEKPYLEYVDGVVLQKPMPNEDHGRIAFRIGFLIPDLAGQHSGQDRRRDTGTPRRPPQLPVARSLLLEARRTIWQRGAPDNCGGSPFERSDGRGTP
ncbi:MAG: Uma2 family endonuclease [Dehalococcoidia bacterium]|nr:Uma2 family endonuclease [Dehalococcoidia bacterium]